MAVRGVDKAVATLKGLRPRLSSAYVTSISLETNVDRQFDTPDNYEFTRVASADDPDLSWAPRWQRRFAAGPMSRGEWVCLVAHDKDLDGLRVGHVWTTFASTRSLGNGMLNVNLRDDEAYVWDLFIHPDHRRMSLGNAMGQALIDTFGPRGVKWGYTHVLMDNTSSVVWHHMFGFDAIQTVNCVNVGDRFWWKLPFSASPRFGPLTQQGRHNQVPVEDPVGSGLLPPEWARG
jgi:ribosomal protein S18 acetylase RimI-like enzyme